MTNQSIKTMDPNILLSMINMKLRDQYSSLEILCYELELAQDEIINRLETIGYKYRKEQNQFK